MVDAGFPHLIHPGSRTHTVSRSASFDQYEISRRSVAARVDLPDELHGLLIHHLIFKGCAAVYVRQGKGFNFMHLKKQRAPWVPVLIKPPGPLASLQEWLDCRAGLDMLEAELRVSHPDLDWLDGTRTFKDEADAVIGRMAR